MITSDKIAKYFNFIHFSTICCQFFWNTNANSNFQVVRFVAENVRLVGGALSGVLIGFGLS